MGKKRTGEVKSGYGKAMKAATEAYQPPPAAQQQDLLEDTGLLGLPVPTSTRGKNLIVEKRGPGRPPGATNKRTEKSIQYLLSRYRDPRETLLAIQQTPVDELAARLNCSAKEALQEIRLAAIGVLPYTAQRLPLAVELTDHKIIRLVINEAPTKQAGGVGLTARVIEGEVQSVEDEESEHD